MDKRKNLEDIYPLSPMQQGIIFHTQLAPNEGLYVPQVCLTIEGKLDVEKFHQAWEKVVARHQVLRTSFQGENRQKPFQVVYRQVNLPWQEHDWQESTNEEQEKLFHKLLNQDSLQNFNLKKAPLFRLNFIKLAENKYKLIWTQHHLILDGWSSALVLREVFTLYHSRNTYLPLPRPYGEYIAWLGKQDISAAKNFWTKKLQGFTKPTDLRVGNSTSVSQENFQQEQEIKLSAQLTSEVKLLAKVNQLTLNTVIQGIFALLISRYSDEEDIVFGITSSGRSSELLGVESMVGLLINTLPLRVQVKPQTQLIPWLQKLQKEHNQSLQYEYSPLWEIQSWSDLPAGISLFETILVLENYPVDAAAINSQENLQLTEVKSLEWTSFPLTVLVGVGAEISLKVKYHGNRFEFITISNFLNHFSQVIQSVTSNPHQKLGEISLLTATEKEKILKHWNNTEVSYPQDRLIHQLFAAQAELNPQAIALSFEKQQLTYQKLNLKANQLAHYLQKIGVGAEVLVAINIERSLAMVIAILAVIKAGGAYVPIDPSYPQERQELMLADSQVTVLLTNNNSTIINQKEENLNIINLDTDWELINQESSENPVNQITLENSVYVIYTSGSTGKPKGVINTHQGLLNRLWWMQETYQLNKHDRVLQKTPFSFDVSVWEFLWTLANGATLVIAKPEGHKDSAYLVNLIQQKQITTLHFVPSMLQAFLEEKYVESCTSIQRVICSGEALSREVEAKFSACLKAKIYNLYGPTEAAIDVTHYSCQSPKLTQNKSSTVPIGVPIANTQIYLLDSQQQLVPIGIPGELHIGGIGLARGYLNQPELTAQKFIPNPIPPLKRGVRGDQRLYKTGDLARYLPSGNIEFLGRLDHQVKLRGLRIELKEIATILQQHFSVKNCVVTVREEQENNQYLVAYLILNSQQEQSELETQWQEFLAAKLPNYMIPDAFVILEAFPLTPNGKLNQQALPAPQFKPTTVFVPPNTPKEKIIAEIWTEILPVEKVGIHDNFFALGGNSLLATRVNSRLRQALEMDLPLRALFERPTVASLAQRIEVMERAIKASVPNSNSGGKRIEMEI